MDNSGRRPSGKFYRESYKNEHDMGLNCTVYYKPSEAVKNMIFGKIHQLYHSTHRSRLIYALTYKIDDILIRQRIVNMLDQNCADDMQFYIFCRDLLQNIEKKETPRGQYRISSIRKYTSIIDNIQPTSYLDIGCFKGDITREIGAHFGLSKSQICGIDIKQYQDIPDFTFDIYDGITIPYTNDSFDLITCFMVLHHVPSDNLVSLLSEIYRVMRPNGLLILREHDANPFDKNNVYLLDVLHEYYDHVLNESDTWESSKAFYNKESFWRRKIIEAGFVCHRIPLLRQNNKKNPFNNYICGFYKV